MIISEDGRIIGESVINKIDYDLKSANFRIVIFNSEACGRGIATSHCIQLENSVKSSIITHASITAKPFFEKRGYIVLKNKKLKEMVFYLQILL